MMYVFWFVIGLVVGTVFAGLLAAGGRADLEGRILFLERENYKLRERLRRRNG